MNYAAFETHNIRQESNMYMQLTAIVLTCSCRDCRENLACLTMHDVADPEVSEWRPRLTKQRIEVQNATRREPCCEAVLYALRYTVCEGARKEMSLEGGSQMRSRLSNAGFGEE